MDLFSEMHFDFLESLFCKLSFRDICSLRQVSRMMNQKVSLFLESSGYMRLAENDIPKQFFTGGSLVVPTDSNLSNNEYARWLLKLYYYSNQFAPAPRMKKLDMTEFLSMTDNYHHRISNWFVVSGHIFADVFSQSGNLHILVFDGANEKQQVWSYIRSESVSDAFPSYEYGGPPTVIEMPGLKYQKSKSQIFLVYHTIIFSVVIDWTKQILEVRDNVVISSAKRGFIYPYNCDSSGLLSLYLVISTFDGSCNGPDVYGTAVLDAKTLSLVHQTRNHDILIADQNVALFAVSQSPDTSCLCNFYIEEEWNPTTDCHSLIRCAETYAWFRSSAYKTMAISALYFVCLVVGENNAEYQFLIGKRSLTVDKTCYNVVVSPVSLKAQPTFLGAFGALICIEMSSPHGSISVPCYIFKIKASGDSNETEMFPMCNYKYNCSSLLMAFFKACATQQRLTLFTLVV